MDQYNNQMMERELDWEDEIEDTGNDYIDIPDGVYDFLVESVEYGRSNGTDKIPACKQVIVHLLIGVPGIGQARLNAYFTLWSTLQWKICDFYKSIGLQQNNDQKVKMRWNITGAKGRCEINHYQKKGSNKSYNQIKRFIPTWETADQTTPNNGYNNNQGGFTPGRF